MAIIPFIEMVVFWHRVIACELPPVKYGAWFVSDTVIGIVVYAVPQLLLTEYVIVAEPRAMPVTIPPVVTVAIIALLLLHTPPVTVFARVVVKPVPTDDAPVMLPAVGNALTVTTVVAAHPPDGV